MPGPDIDGEQLVMIHRLWQSLGIDGDQALGSS